MNKSLAEIEVEGPALTETLRRMAKLGRGTPGLGTWSLGAEGLRISWMGMSALLEGSVSGDALMVVSSRLMRGLAKVTDWPKIVHVVAYQTELTVSPMTFDAELRAHAPPQLLALNATAKDLVQLHLREPHEKLERAGLTDDITAALKRLDESCATAAKTLRWLDITPDDLRQWIFDQLGVPKPAPTPQVVVVEPTGQVRLFDES